MSERYAHTLSLSIGGDVPTWEGEATVSYEVNPEEPERGPSYSRGGMPRVPAEVVDVTVTHIDGRKLGADFYDRQMALQIEDLIESNDGLLNDLLVAAAEDDIGGAEAAEERRWEERRA